MMPPQQARPSRATRIVDQLHAALSSEPTAIVQYRTQSEMCQSWGYKRLGDTKMRAIEEMQHAQGLIERIVFLDGIPKLEVGLTPQFGNKVQEHRFGDHLQSEIRF